MMTSVPIPSHLSSVYGRIRQVLLVRSGFDTAETDVSLREIISSYESQGIQVLVLEKEPPQSSHGHAEAGISLEHRMVADMLQKGLREVLRAEMDIAQWQREFEVITELGLPLAHSEWAQDGFAVLNYDGHSQILLQSLSSRRFLDQFVSFELTLKRQLSMFLQPTLTEWEGGNILVADDFALVGKNTLATNWRNTLLRMTDEQRSDPQYLETAFEEMKQDMERQLGLQEVIWVGYPSVRRDLMNARQFCYQPLFHIDLFLTLAAKGLDGTETLFIGDPGLAWKILKAAGLQDQIRPPGLTWEGDQLTAQMISHSINRDMMDFFGDYNLTSTSRQFNTISLPMLIEQGVVYSWNNCLIEIAHETSRAYVPNYIIADAGSRALAASELGRNRKMEVLQQAVKEIMLTHGIREVIWTGHGLFMQHFAQRKGSLHCLTKVLRRDPYGLGRIS